VETFEIIGLIALSLIVLGIVVNIKDIVRYIYISNM
jgi:hypothetical protein